MNIGIVTETLFNNYGGILQNFALQHVLRSIGHTPITIDYIKNERSYIRFCVAQFLTFVSRLIGSKKRMYVTYSKASLRPPKIANFLRLNINLTQPVQNYSYSIIDSYCLDCIIVGSDQVWCPKCKPKGLIQNLYLSFANDSNIKKIAYAASFGDRNWVYDTVMTKQCALLAKKFDAISTREDSGVLLCRDYLGVDAVGVLDPTLLLEKQVYLDLCRCVPKNENILFAYVLDINDAKRNFIMSVASSKGLIPKIVSIGNQDALSVEEWIAMFRDSSFVITDSFHGSVFSIIFNCDFYAILNSGRGGDRFISLFRRLGLEKRLLVDQLIDEGNTISWSDVNSKRNEWIEISLKYLKENLC